MKTVAVHELEAQLNELLEEVERGESVTITRHGRAVATLAPVVGERKMTLAEIGEAFRELRSRLPSGGPSIRELIDEGRRY